MFYSGVHPRRMLQAPLAARNEQDRPPSLLPFCIGTGESTAQVAGGAPSSGAFSLLGARVAFFQSDPFYERTRQVISHPPDAPGFRHRVRRPVFGGLLALHSYPGSTLSRSLYSLSPPPPFGLLFLPRFQYCRKPSSTPFSCLATGVGAFVTLPSSRPLACCPQRCITFSAFSSISPSPRMENPGRKPRQATPSVPGTP